MKFQQARWVEFDPTTTQLKSLEGKQLLQMFYSNGTALPLLLDDSRPQKFGADLIRFSPGKGVAMHTHVGAHILFVTKGEGVLVYGRTESEKVVYERHRMFPGMVYLIPSNVPHAIENETEMVIIAVGNDHRPADSQERLEIVET